MSQFVLDVPAAAKPPKNTSVFRPDVQGLRAVAVLAVIADHLLGYPAGGFVGVDIFFVLSGFLITGLLLREQEKNGRLSFATFYRRRIRRLLPVAVIVLAVTVGASWLLFSTGRAESITVDGFWALIFGANWHFAALGTDYMQAEGPVSPLQHFWSLAVEEQFYVVWPWVIVLVLGFLASRAKWDPATARRVLGIIFAVVIVATFAFACWETAASPSLAYFSTMSRTWELAVGALLALCAGAFSRLSARSRTLLGYTGLAGIAWSFFFVTPQMAFPGPWAAIPVLASALVIAAGTGGEQKFLFPLTNPVSRYIGDISYSLYLWHFPVIVMMGALLPDVDIVAWSLMVLGMFALSIASYHFIEDPIRHSAWLEPGHKKKRSSHGLKRNTKATFAGLGVLALVTAMSVTFALDKASPPPDTAAYQTPIVDIRNRTSPAPAPSTAAEMLSSEISAALVATEWPELNPNVDSLKDEFVPEWKTDKCLDISDANMAGCVYGDPEAAKTAVLLGDSVSISWMPSLRESLGKQGWKIQLLTKGQCPAVDVPVTRANDPDGFTKSCSQHQAWVMDKIAKINPDMVIVTSALNSVTRLAAEGTREQSLGAWEKATVARLTDLQTVSDTQVVLLSAAEQGKNLMECATKVSRPSDCVATNRMSLEVLAVEKRAAESVPGVRFVSTGGWFCSLGQCPAFVGRIPVFVDGVHLTPAYSSKLAPVIGPALLGE